MLFLKVFFVLLLFGLSGCENSAVFLTPAKKTNLTATDLSKKAEESFWAHLHDGDYDKLSTTIDLLTAAYIQNPNNPQLAAHLGFAHIWKITERSRVSPIPATIVNEIILAKKFFEDAAMLSPKDARYQGFLGDAMLVESTIFNDERSKVRAFFQLKRAIDQWPEFNLFTAGYPMSELESNSPHFQEALNWQWQTLDLCAGTKLDRSNPDFKPFLSLATTKGPKRACWNSWIAPHNYEGFFLNMGDMLVKHGDWQTAIKIYNNAKYSKSYASWAYKNMLEKRMIDAQENINYFRDKKYISKDRTILFNSGYGCVVCHQA